MGFQHCVASSFLLFWLLQYLLFYYFDWLTKIPWLCIHGHKTHSLQHTDCVGHPRAKSDLLGKHQASIWPGGKWVQSCLEERAWEVGKAKGLFWQSRKSRVHRKPKLVEILYRFYTDFTERWSRKINPCLRNCFISVEKSLE